MSCHVMSCHGMSAWVVFGLATLPFLTMRVLQVRFHDDIDGSSLARAIYASTGPLLLPFDSGFSTHSKPLGHDFRTKTWSVINCVVSTVLCCDMEHGAQMSVTSRCLLQQKPKEVSRRSAQFPLKKADKSKPLHPIFRLFSKQPTTDKKAGNGMVLFLYRS